MNIVAYSFLCKNVGPASQTTEPVVTPRTADSDKHFFGGMFDDKQALESQESIEASLQFQKEEEIKEEIKKFSTLIGSKDFFKSNISSNKFWKENKLEYPNLCTLFKMLNSINASSAYIERSSEIYNLIFN